MSIVSTIEGISEALSGAPKFYYAGNFEHNRNDKMDYSTGVVNLREIEEPGLFINRKTGTIRQRCPVQIQFIEKAKNMDDTAVSRNVVVSKMWRLAAEFVQRLDESEKFDELASDIISGLTVINRYDNNVTGVEINFVLIAKEPMNIC